ncbi:hypothetical protein F2Q69_00025706, partial [Brassica cretica]
EELKCTDTIDDDSVVLLTTAWGGYVLFFFTSSVSCTFQMFDGYFLVIFVILYNNDINGRSSEKRVSSVAISGNDSHVCYADKFGVVWVVELEGINEGNVLPSKKGAPLLSHYCSIITSLEFSPDGRYILSADRDFKIRVTFFPRKPLQGAHEIQSFCLGHTEFVTCIAFVWNPELTQGYLMSGSGDSTVSYLKAYSSCIFKTSIA